MSEDLIGLKRGDWTVVEVLGATGTGKDLALRVLSQCKCGYRKTHRLYDLTAGRTRKCQACRIRDMHESQLKHGHSQGQCHTRTYSIWCSIKARCLNPNANCFDRYGGRGITIDDRWLDFSSFLADMGPVPDGKILGRYNVDEGYNLENCEWMTRKESAGYATYGATPINPGDKFGWWIVLNQVKQPQNDVTGKWYRCRCDSCARSRDIRAITLRQGAYPLCSSCMSRKPRRY